MQRHDPPDMMPHHIRVRCITGDDACICGQSVILCPLQRRRVATYKYIAHKSSPPLPFSYLAYLVVNMCSSFQQIGGGGTSARSSPGAVLAQSNDTKKLRIVVAPVRVRYWRNSAFGYAAIC
jgi:hypothetical protein